MTRGRRRNFIVDRQRELVRAQYTTLLLLLSYLVLPGVSSVIFRTYACVNVDPDGALPSRQVFMRSDYSISCGSERHQLGVIWASIMIFVYPIGVPAMYLYLLYQVCPLF